MKYERFTAIIGIIIFILTLLFYYKVIMITTLSFLSGIGIGILIGIIMGEFGNFE